jgi:hypothetical protein
MFPVSCGASANKQISNASEQTEVRTVDTADHMVYSSTLA